MRWILMPSPSGAIIAIRRPRRRRPALWSELEPVMHLALEVAEDQAQEWGGLGQGDAGEGDQVQPEQGGGEPLVVAGQAAPPRLPGEPALGHPTLRQEDEAALGLGQLDDDQLDAGRLRRGRGRLAL